MFLRVIYLLWRPQYSTDATAGSFHYGTLNWMRLVYAYSKEREANTSAHGISRAVAGATKLAGPMILSARILSKHMRIVLEHMTAFICLVRPVGSELSPTADTSKSRPGFCEPHRELRR